MILLAASSSCSGEPAIDPLCGLAPENVAVEQVGGVLVLPANAHTLRGQPGEVAPDLERIARQVLAYLPFDVEQIALWTSGFRTDRQAGPMYQAYSIDCSEQLAGFALMGRWGVGGLAPVRLMAEEFSHAWLAYARFQDPVTGEVSEELLGRDAAHWSALLQTFGSFQDGDYWAEVEPGTFELRFPGRRSRFSPLDLWLMGLLDESDVPPFFLLRDARDVSRGRDLDATSHVPWESQVSATRLDLTAADVAAATSVPPRRETEIRQVFVLLVPPDREEALAAEDAAQLDRFRLAWTAQAQEELYCRSPLCTEPDGSCPQECEASCGDGVCQNPETPDTCPQDCGEEHQSCRLRCQVLSAECDGLDESDEFRCRTLCGPDPERGTRSRNCEEENDGPDRHCQPHCLEILFGD